MMYSFCHSESRRRRDEESKDRCFSRLWRDQHDTKVVGSYPFRCETENLKSAQKTTNSDLCPEF